MSGFKKTVFFNFLAKGRDDLKIKRKVNLFLPLPVYLPFTAVLSLFFLCYMACRLPLGDVKSK